MMGSNLPGVTSHRRPKRMGLDETQLASIKVGTPIKIKSGTTDPGNTGYTNTLRPGTVVIEETGSTGYHVLANDQRYAAQGSVATITAAEAADGDWVSKVFKLFRNGVKVAEVTAAGDDDDATKIAEVLNADQAFAANAKASVSSSKVVITDVLGRGDALKVEVDLATAYANAFDSDGGGSNDASYAEAVGSVPDVRVLGEEVHMLDSAGNAIAGFSGFNFYSGHFARSQLVCGSDSGIPASAEGVLKARGSKITAS